MVKIKAVGQNPADWQLAQDVLKPGSAIGIDGTGVIESVGDNVPASATFTQGDRVGFFTNPESNVHGAFAEYVAVPWERLFRIPDSISFEQAAALRKSPLSLRH